MATIYPFSGLRYNPQKISSMADVIAPPYDVIGPEEQEELYKISPYNIIRLEYGKESEQDNQEDNRYTRAAKNLDEWLSQGVLIKDEPPVFYWYEQRYSWEGDTFVRDGIIVSLKTEPYENKSVIPHEETLSKPKEDRLQLLRHCRTNFSPIFGLFPDRERTVENKCSNIKENSPTVDFQDYDGQSHRLWKIEDQELQNELHELFSNFTIFIADGHHRYETALTFSQEMEAQGKQGYDRVLAVLVNLFNPGLLILPTHRIIYDLEDLNLENLIQHLQEDFIIEEWASAREVDLDHFTEKLKLEGKDKFACGMITPEKVYLLKMKPSEVALEEKLDVTWLQEKVLENKLHLTAEDINAGDKLAYSRSAREAIESVTKGNAQLSFLLNPPGVDQTIKIAKTNERLPQKSTYFFPKLISGLVLNKLD